VAYCPKLLIQALFWSSSISLSKRIEPSQEDFRMAITSKELIVVGCLLSLASALYAASDWLKGSTDEKFKTQRKSSLGWGR